MTTGTLLWSYRTNSLVGLMSSPAFANGVVYFGSDDGNIYARDAGSGIELWRHTTGGRVRSSPAVSNGVVYVGSDDGNVYALNATAGSELWRYTTEPALHRDGGIYSPAVANGVVYVAANTGYMYAFGLTDRTGAIPRPLPNTLHRNRAPDENDRPGARSRSGRRAKDCFRL